MLARDIEEGKKFEATQKAAGIALDLRHNIVTTKNLKYELLD